MGQSEELGGVSVERRFQGVGKVVEGQSEELGGVSVEGAGSCRYVGEEVLVMSSLTCF